MQFLLLDFKMNDTCDCTNFTHLTWLLLLHYLVKFETPKMHVNTTSYFIVSRYLQNNRYMHQIYIDSFIKYSDESYNEHSYQNMCFRYQHAHMISDGRATGQS